ncbi:6-hydroxy-D-nicotine oxidase [Streptomyces spiralis]|uniref:6-hydroxy-D-nicotine oxidase n=1 Tax=Streptomyces spiralis TaxID=66376 RepID=A0A919A7V8_9ACTN|nr:FAD-binding oxidoreductase [Streptomyces spiralis]GHE92190.1 6-hydroxy-D-nicotine oxidase [Streptomyces spiralis]
MQNPTPVRGAVRELLTQLDPEQVLTDGPGYQQGIRLWNGAVRHRPALIVRPRTPAQVQAAVLAARGNGPPLSVRGGGHDWAGRSLCPGGLVVDLSSMRQVVIDPRRRTAIVQGGATAGDVVTATAPYGLCPATGTVAGVGMTGLTLAGGYGPLNGRAGLALDNLLAADVVLADGRLVTADPDREPELYWALRGGGGNFGAVTSLRIRLHPVPRLVAGLITYPLPRAARVWERLNAFLAAAPDELTVQSGLVSGPDGSPALFPAPVWSGSTDHGEAAISPLQRLGSPLSTQTAPMPLAQMLRLNEQWAPAGRHYAIATRTLTRFTPGATAGLAEAAATRTSPLTGIAVHHFHGAATRVPLESTAFGLRHDHFVVEIVAVWAPGDRRASHHRAWADATSAALAPHALPGGYAQLLGPDAHDQAAHAYGPHTGRLSGGQETLRPRPRLRPPLRCPPPGTTHPPSAALGRPMARNRIEAGSRVRREALHHARRAHGPRTVPMDAHGLPHSRNSRTNRKEPA